jgi:hypothetical protein
MSGYIRCTRAMNVDLPASIGSEEEEEVSSMEDWAEIRRVRRAEGSIKATRG